MSIKSFTLRMPETMYKEVEARRRKSIAEYVLEAVHEKLAREHEAELARGFQSLADADVGEATLWVNEQKKAMKQVDG